MELVVKVVPKSAKTGIAGYLPDGSWKIKVAAAPDKGKANRELCKFLAAHFGVACSKVTIVSGLTSRIKRVRIAE